MPGRIVVLHGTSSSGKTTVARAMQRLSDEPWVRHEDPQSFVWTATAESILAKVHRARAALQQVVNQ